MHRLRAVALLLLVAALLPTGLAGSAADPELTDAAGDQAVSAPTDGVPTLPVTPPVAPPLVTPPTFDDIDLTAAWFEERAVDCVGAAPLTCPTLTLVVQTTAGWTTGTLQVSFKTESGPTSLPGSTVSGQAVNFTVTGTTVTGLANATAAAGADGLRIEMPVPRLGLVGGDLVSGLQLASSRLDAGPLEDPSLTQDDAQGTDQAGPGDAYTMARAPRQDRFTARVTSVAGQAGATATITERDDVTVTLEVTNVGTDPAQTTLDVDADPALPGFPGAILPVTRLARLESTTLTVTVPFEQAAAGTTRLRFTFEGDSEPSATATIAFAPVVADRAVKPAGLDFLTPAAEGAGLDKAFGSYAELALLAVSVLLVILAVYLLVALAPSTLAGASAPESPPVAAAAATGDAAPAGLLAAAPAPAPRVANPPAPSGAATPGGALAIESVTHVPDAPEAGQDVATEVVLRNPGPTRQVRVVLAVDGLDRDEKAVTLPARATKTLTLAWTAGPGENRVKVRVLPA